MSTDAIKYEVRDLAKRIGAEVVWAQGTTPVDVWIDSIAPIEHAPPNSVSFIARSDYAHFGAQTKAAALIVGSPFDDVKAVQLVAKDPYLAFAKTAGLFDRTSHGKPGVDEHAVVDASAKLGADVVVKARAVIGAGARLGARVVVYPGVVVGEDCEVGDDTVIYPNVTLYRGTKLGKRCIIHAGAVIGADGFGFAPGPDGILKIPQLGIVEIEDDVEIGANTTIDRAALGATRIGRGTKLDNLVQIAHNVTLGKSCMFASLVGVAGSTKIGNGVLIGGHSGVNGHIEIADGAKIGGMTGVVQSIKDHQSYVGYPAVLAGEWRRRHVLWKRFTEVEKYVRTKLMKK